LKLIRKFRAWWQKFRSDKVAKRREAGYAYAKRVFDSAGNDRESQKLAVIEIENNVDCSITFGDFDEFDEGMQDFLKECSHD
jgi:hypothetical protein